MEFFSLVLRPVVLAPLSLVPGQAVAALLLPVRAPGLVLAELPSPGPAGGLVPVVGPLLPEVVSVLVPALAERPSSELGPAEESVPLVLPALVAVELTWWVVPLARPEGPEHSGSQVVLCDRAGFLD